MKISKDKLKKIIKEELEAVMKETELEEAGKGPKLSQLGSMSSPGQTVTDLAMADDSEPLAPEEDFFDSESEKMSSSAEVIEVALEELGIDPSSPEGQKLAADLRAAAEVHKQRGDVKYKDMDKLAGRQPVGMTKSGTLRKSDVASRKRDIKGNIGLEEAQEMEQISESFRRYTKILKD
jgi:hypothetical protein